MIKKVLFVFIFFFLFTVNVNAKEKKKYLALGDSITYGYGLDDVDNEAFPVLFSKKHKLELTKEAVSGDKTQDLLDKLNNYNINDYDVITLCIGANDVLKEFINDIEGMNYGEIINYIVDIDNNEDFQNRINQNIEQFKINFEKIMNIIKQGHAQIYLMNIYNPYKGFFLESLDVQSNKIVKRINEVIDGYKKDAHFIDLYKKFDSSKKNLINSQSTRKEYAMDPHPSPEGHKYISELLSNEYELHNIDEPYLILTIILGTLVILFELLDVIYTFKRFNIKSPNNVDIKPKLDDTKEEENKSSCFIRS